MKFKKIMAGIILYVNISCFPLAYKFKVIQMSYIERDLFKSCLFCSYKTNIILL